MIVVVGGQARKVGKTRAVCDIVAATREARWIAIKVSPHEHGPTDRETDTDRYVAAGAAEALLVRKVPVLPTDRNVIIESNAALESVEPDLFVLVTDPAVPEWKESARRVIERADYVVNGAVPPQVLDRISELLRLCPPGSRPGQCG